VIVFPAALTLIVNADAITGVEVENTNVAPPSVVEGTIELELDDEITQSET
jgi:hypothetical protein